MTYVPNPQAVRQEMLKVIGLESMEELFTDIPAKYHLRQLDLGSGLSELEVRRKLTALADKNLSTVSHPTFLGAGAYDLQRSLTRNAGKYLKKYWEEDFLRVEKCPAAPLRREIIRLWLDKNRLTNSLSRALIDRIDDLWKSRINNKTVCHRHFKVVWSKKRLLLVKIEDIG